MPRGGTPKPHPPITDCPSTRHTETGIRKYGCICEVGYADQRRASRERKAASGRVPGLGTARRVQALAMAGWCRDTVAAQAGVCERVLDAAIHGNNVSRVTADAVAVVYDRLSTTLGPSRQSIYQARGKGWVGPWCWTPETIDNPFAGPCWTDLGDDRIDEVAVARVVAGHADPDLLVGKPERRAAVRRMIASGVSINETIERLRTSGHAITKALAETG